MNTFKIIWQNLKDTKYYILRYVDFYVSGIYKG